MPRDEIQSERSELYNRIFSPDTMSRGFQSAEVLRGTELMRQTIAKKRRNNNNNNHHKVILAYTSNIISSGLRECIAALIAAGVVDAIVTTAGGIEEDLIKCLGPTLVGDFSLEGNSLRDKGLNRIGNLLVPNNNYALFESFFRTVLHEHLARQRASNCNDLAACGPSDFLRTAGECLTRIEGMVAKERSKTSSKTSSNASSPVNTTTSCNINNDNDDDGFSSHLQNIDLDILREQQRHSVAYQCWQHNVPIFCPAFTDGSMGDMTFFFNVSHPGLVIDPLLDAVRLEKILGGGGDGGDTTTLTTTTTTTAGVISVGGGLPKHFALRACSCCKLEEAILITTSAPLVDGSVSAGTPQDDQSQLLCSATASVAHVRVEATLCFPFMVANALFSK